MQGWFPRAGVDVLFKHGRRLVGNWTTKFKSDVLRVTESQFANDVALYAGSQDRMKSMAVKFVEKASIWGLRVSMEKTKRMALGEGLGDVDVAPVTVEGGEIHVVDSLTYLSSFMSSDGEVMKDVKACRIAKASEAFGYLRIFDNPIVFVPIKKAVQRAVVLAELLYG